MSAQSCGRCGRFVAANDRIAVYAFEVGEFGQLLSKWPVSCRHCAPDPVIAGVLNDFEGTRLVLKVNGNEVCCWHGHANCAGCCVAGQCDLHPATP